MKRLNVAEMPEACPSCGFVPVGTIYYGEIEISDRFQEEVLSGRTIIGGPCGGTNLPKWACKNCGCEFMHDEDDEACIM